MQTFIYLLQLSDTRRYDARRKITETQKIQTQFLDKVIKAITRTCLAKINTCAELVYMNRETVCTGIHRRGTQKRQETHNQFIHSITLLVGWFCAAIIVAALRSAIEKCLCARATPGIS